eukprot:TRINITY_DN6649_c0_g8_i1.p1 TRINITY_DN6649_c0_g8~~TRINITY_DN6649_c0_g8_i1.p1  ORF type:complete len:575 (+),score=94.87 TRINITY_DN6649_c0_g8_i1:60-1784(+)
MPQPRSAMSKHSDSVPVPVRTVCVGDSSGAPFPVGMEVEVHLLRAQSEMNGMVGFVVGYTQGRVAVQFPKGRKALRAENLRPTGNQRLVADVVKKAEEDRRRAEEAEREEQRQAEQAKAREEWERMHKIREQLAAARASERGPPPRAPVAVTTADAGAGAAAGRGGVGRWYAKFDVIDDAEDLEKQEERARQRREFRDRVQGLSAQEAAARTAVSEAAEAARLPLGERRDADAAEAAARQQRREEREAKQAAIDRALAEVRGPVPAPPKGWTGSLPGGRLLTCIPPPQAATVSGRTMLVGRIEPLTGRAISSVPLNPVTDLVVRAWAWGDTASGPLIDVTTGEPPRPVLPPEMQSMPDQRPHPAAASAPKHIYTLFRRPLQMSPEDFAKNSQVRDRKVEHIYWRVVLRYSSSGICVAVLHTLRELRVKGWTHVLGHDMYGWPVELPIDGFRMHTLEWVPNELHYTVTKYEPGFMTVELLEDSKGGVFCHQVLVNDGWVFDPAGAGRGWAGHRGALLRWPEFEQGTEGHLVKLRTVCERTEWVHQEYGRYERRVNGVVEAVTTRMSRPPTDRRSW